MFDRILVPLDGSQLAERVLVHAEQFANVFGSTLVLFHVLDPSPYREQRTIVEPLNWQIRKMEAEVYLQQAAAELQKKEIKVETILREGSASENIIDFAHQENIDLLAISTHGASGLSRWNSSSTFHKVVSKVYTNLLVVRAYRGEEMAGQKSPYQRILVPIDRSRRAECSLPPAAALAETSQAGLVLAAIIQRPELLIPPPHPQELLELIDKFMGYSRQAIEDYLSDLQKRLPGQAETIVLESSSVFHSIHEIADQVDASLLVFCAHGHTGGFTWPYGSVVSNYLDYGTRPMLVIQDIPLSQVRPTLAEVAAEKYGRR